MDNQNRNNQAMNDQDFDHQSFDYKARYEFICRVSAKDNEQETLAAALNDDLNQLNSYIHKDLATLARRGCPDSFADILHTLELELVRFRQFCEFPDLAQKVIIGIGGKFSAGKSSLINVLLGKKQLVTEIDPTTSLPTYLLKGSTPSITAINLFNKKVTLSQDEFQSLTHEEKEKYGSQIGSLLSSAFISDPDFQWDHLALLDTPGYTKPEDDSHSERTDEAIARSQLNAAQFILWLVSAEDGTIKEDDLAFLSSLNSDIPRLVLINKSDKKTPEDINDIVALVKKILVDRNLPALEVIPVSRKKRSYPLEPVLKWFNAWNVAAQEVTFAKNFKRQFRLYEQYIESAEREAHTQLNLLNRIITLADDDAISKDAQAMQQSIKSHLVFLQALEDDLNHIQQLFFDKLDLIGEQVGIDLPKLDAFDDIDFQQVHLLKLLTTLRESSGKKLIDYSPMVRELMLPAQVKNIDCLIRRTSDRYIDTLQQLTITTDETALSRLLRQESHELAQNIFK